MKRFIPGILLGLLPLTLTAFAWLNRDHLRPNGVEWVALALCVALYASGAVILASGLRQTKTLPDAHKREMEARRQKRYESLPPGRL